jgi:hypothetical protein
MNIKDEKQLVVSLPIEIHKALKSICCDKEVSMSELIREEIHKILNKYNKPID